MLLPVGLFMLGAIIASFIGVVVARLNTGEGFLTGRSRCDACTATLPPYTMVPILSYAFSRGRAHCCGAHISCVAPLTEALLGALFILSYDMIGVTAALPLFFASLALILALALYDLAHQILPTPLLMTFVCVAALTGFLLAPSPDAFYATLIPAILIAGSLALIYILSRGRAMGFADTPFAFGLSLLVGPAALPGFIFSFWVGAVIGIVILFLRPIGSRIGVEVPFAPFLAAGFLLAYFTQWNPFLLIAGLH